MYASLRSKADSSDIALSAVIRLFLFVSLLLLVVASKEPEILDPQDRYLAKFVMQSCLGLFCMQKSIQP